jgi:hypothetical protein
MLCLLVLLLSVARADTVNLGYFIFVNLEAPDPPLPGTNGFEINNLTGVFALPPDFPIADGLTLQSASLTLTGDVNQVVLLGDMGPGSVTPFDSLFPDTTQILSAELTATLSDTTFLLDDGSSFQASSPVVHAILMSSSGPDKPNNIDDFAVITVSGDLVVDPPPPPPPGEIPEPSSYWLLIGVVPWVLMKRRQRGTAS